MNLQRLDDFRIYVATRADANQLAILDRACNPSNFRSYLDWIEIINNQLLDTLVAFAGIGSANLVGVISALRNNIEIFNVASMGVASMHTVGRKLAQSLIDVQKKKYGDLDALRLVVDETTIYANKSYQNFFKEVGFKSTRIIKDIGHDCGYPVDGILFEMME